MTVEKEASIIRVEGMRGNNENPASVSCLRRRSAAAAAASCARVTSRSGGRAISWLELMLRRRLAALPC